MVRSGDPKRRPPAFGSTTKAEMPACACRRIGLGIDDDEVGLSGVGDEMLGAGDAVAVAFAHRPCRHVGRVGARAGFGQRECTEAPVGCAGQIAVPLRLVTAIKDRNRLRANAR